MPFVTRRLWARKGKNVADSVLGIAAEQGQDLAPAPEPTTVLTEAPNTDGSVSEYIKGLFASTETSEVTTGDWLQLEQSTFRDLKNRGKIRSDIAWGELKVNPATYNEVARAYINDLMTTFSIPTVEEAALWSYRPGYYKKYGGNISHIPESIPGSAGKSVREVMMDRQKNLNYFIERNKNAPN